MLQQMIGKLLNKSVALKRILAKLFLKLAGWKVAVNDVPALHHSVMIGAPHTSNWDVPYTLAAFWIMGVPLKFFIKDSYTKPPVIGWFFKAIGAIGVNRGQRNNLIDYTVQLLNEQKDFCILVPVEGTRKRVKRWKKGFYHIAIKAKVPVALGYLDYKKKVAGVFEMYRPTGNFEEDMQYIQAKYQEVNARYPEQFNRKIF